MTEKLKKLLNRQVLLKLHSGQECTGLLRWSGRFCVDDLPVDPGEVADVLCYVTSADPHFLFSPELLWQHLGDRYLTGEAILTGYARLLPARNPGVFHVSEEGSFRAACVPHASLTQAPALYRLADGSMLYGTLTPSTPLFQQEITYTLEAEEQEPCSLEFSQVAQILPIPKIGTDIQVLTKAGSWVFGNVLAIRPEGIQLESRDAIPLEQVQELWSIGILEQAKHSVYIISSLEKYTLADPAAAAELQNHTQVRFRGVIGAGGVLAKQVEPLPGSTQPGSTALLLYKKDTDHSMMLVSSYEDNQSDSSVKFHWNQIHNALLNTILATTVYRIWYQAEGDELTTIHFLEGYSKYDFNTVHLRENGAVDAVRKVPQAEAYGIVHFYFGNEVSPAKRRLSCTISQSFENTDSGRFKGAMYYVFCKPEQKINAKDNVYAVKYVTGHTPQGFGIVDMTVLKEIPRSQLDPGSVITVSETGKIISSTLETPIEPEAPAAKAEPTFRNKTVQHIHRWLGKRIDILNADSVWEPAGFLTEVNQRALTVRRDDGTQVPMLLKALPRGNQRIGIKGVLDALEAFRASQRSHVRVHITCIDPETHTAMDRYGFFLDSDEESVLLSTEGTDDQVQLGIPSRDITAISVLGQVTSTQALDSPIVFLDGNVYLHRSCILNDPGIYNLSGSWMEYQIRYTGIGYFPFDAVQARLLEPSTLNVYISAVQRNDIYVYTGEDAPRFSVLRPQEGMPYLDNLMEYDYPAQLRCIRMPGDSRYAEYHLLPESIDLSNPVPKKAAAAADKINVSVDVFLGLETMIGASILVRCEDTHYFGTLRSFDEEKLELVYDTNVQIVRKTAVTQVLGLSKIKEVAEDKKFGFLDVGSGLYFGSRSFENGSFQRGDSVIFEFGRNAVNILANNVRKCTCWAAVGYVISNGNGNYVLLPEGEYPSGRNFVALNTFYTNLHLEDLARKEYKVRYMVIEPEGDSAVRGIVQILDTVDKIHLGYVVSVMGGKDLIYGVKSDNGKVGATFRLADFPNLCTGQSLLNARVQFTVEPHTDFRNPKRKKFYAKNVALTDLPPRSFPVDNGTSAAQKQDISALMKQIPYIEMQLSAQPPQPHWLQANSARSIFDALMLDAAAARNRQDEQLLQYCCQLALKLRPKDALALAGYLMYPLTGRIDSKPVSLEQLMTEETRQRLKQDSSPRLVLDLLRLFHAVPETRAYLLDTVFEKYPFLRRAFIIGLNRLLKLEGEEQHSPKDSVELYGFVAQGLQALAPALPTQANKVSYRVYLQFLSAHPELGETDWLVRRLSDYSKKMKGYNDKSKVLLEALKWLRQKQELLRTAPSCELAYLEEVVFRGLRDCLKTLYLELSKTCTPNVQFTEAPQVTKVGQEYVVRFLIGSLGPASQPALNVNMTVLPAGQLFTIVRKPRAIPQLRSGSPGHFELQLKASRNVGQFILKILLTYQVIQGLSDEYQPVYEAVTQEQEFPIQVTDREWEDLSTEFLIQMGSNGGAQLWQPVVQQILKNRTSELARIKDSVLVRSGETQDYVWEGRWVALYGQWRVGKTQILNKLRYDFDRNADALRSSALTVYLEFPHPDKGDHYETVTVNSIFLAMVNFRSKTLPEEMQNKVFTYWDSEAKLNLDEYGYTFEVLGHILQKFQDLLEEDGCRLILMMDEFTNIHQALIAGKCDTSYMSRFVYMISSSRCLMFTAGGEYTRYLIQSTANAFQKCDQLLEVRYLSKEDTQHYLEAAISDPAFLGSERNKARLVERIYSLTQGNAYLLHRFCNMLIDQVNSNRLYPINDFAIQRAIWACAQSLEALFEYLYDPYRERELEGRTNRPQDFSTKEWNTRLLNGIVACATPETHRCLESRLTEYICSSLGSSDAATQAIVQDRLEALISRGVVRRQASSLEIPIDLFYEVTRMKNKEF